MNGQLDNKELSKLRRTRIGYAFQDFNLIPILTVEENIQMPDEIMEYFIRLNKENITVILVTHEECYAQMCSRKVVIRDGLLTVPAFL